MSHALGGLRRADDSCSPARTAAIEQLDIVEDSRLSSAFSHRTPRAGGLGCRSPARNRLPSIHQYRLHDLAPSAGAAVDTAATCAALGLLERGLRTTRPCSVVAVQGGRGGRQFRLKLDLRPWCHPRLHWGEPAHAATVVPGSMAVCH